MACAERKLLWAREAGELAPPQCLEVDAHLEFCGACVDALEGIRASRLLLQESADMAPEVDWAKVDRKLLAAAARRAGSAPGRWSGWLRRPMPLQTGLALAVAGGALFVLFNRPVAPGEVVEDRVGVAVAAEGEGSQVTAEARVESSTGAVVRGTVEQRALMKGDGLGRGTRIGTPEEGHAVLTLPDESRIEVEGSSDVELEEIGAERVAVRIYRGSTRVQASHVPRESFVVTAADLQVRVLGTSFRVALAERWIDVEVSEGGVLVEPTGAEARLVEAGQIFHWDRVKGTGAFRAAVPTGQERRASRGKEIPAAGPVLPATATPLTAADRLPPPAPLRPGLALPQEPVADTPKLHEGQPLPSTVEALFLRRAEESIGRSDCSRFLNGLEELLEQPGSPAQAEKARILRARCFDDRVMPVDADAEYRRYLRDFPKGSYAAEARRVVAH